MRFTFLLVGLLFIGCNQEKPYVSKFKDKVELVEAGEEMPKCQPVALESSNAGSPMKRYEELRHRVKAANTLLANHPDDREDTVAEMDRGRLPPRSQIICRSTTGSQAFSLLTGELADQYFTDYDRESLDSLFNKVNQDGNLHLDELSLEEWIKLQTLLDSRKDKASDEINELAKLLKAIL